MDIIERAARELYKTEYSGPFGGDEDQYWDIHVEAVKTVLMAIRDPGDAMIGAAMEEGFAPDVATRAYQSMIDAALIQGE